MIDAKPDVLQSVLEQVEYGDKLRVNQHRPAFLTHCAEQSLQLKHFAALEETGLETRHARRRGAETREK